MKIKEAATLTGVTVRTLQYYDRIGLLKPSHVTEAGYRMYEKEDLYKLQQILFLRELEFPLSEIKSILESPDYDRDDMLKKQKGLLEKKRDRLDGIIRLITKTLEGDEDMSFDEFDNKEIEEAKNKYAAEVKERWGTTSAYEESQKKTATYDADKWKSVKAEADAIMGQFGALVGTAPDNKEVQQLVEDWKAHITRNYYTCTDEILAGLGMMYTADERFRQNIDKHGEGTAALMADAIACYVKNR